MTDIEERLSNIEDTLTTLKDNHLHHIEKDVATMKVEIESVGARVGLMEAMMRENFNRIILGLLVIAGAAVGVDVMGVGS